MVIEAILKSLLQNLKLKGVRLWNSTKMGDGQEDELFLPPAAIS
jgi:hypothetical protein